MILADLQEGACVFIDANIFIYHFGGQSLECKAFLERLLLPICREQRLTKLATANGDFDRLGGIEVYKPADLEEDNTE